MKDLKNATVHLKIALGSNMNVSSLTPLAITEIMEDYHQAQLKLMEINEIEKQITEDALNHYWHYVMDMLAKNSLGDIQRANLELDKKRLNELLERFRQPCT